MAKKSAPALRVIGSGEAFSSELGNTSYLLQGGGLPTVLFDCGYQVPERLWKADLHQDIDAICLTHLHADHVFGIVPLVCRFWEEKRKKPLIIFAGTGSESYFQKLINMGYPGLLSRLGFALEFEELSRADELEFEGLKIRTAPTHHSVENLTYRIDFKKSGLKSFAVSGDGRITSETCALVQDVDLLLQEIYSVDSDIPVHMDLQRFSDWAATADIGKIAVAHHARAEVAAIRRRVASLNRRHPGRWVSLKPGMTLSL
jgi:ribonuclease BN (tRNA processing enzyme)